jgi:hypothetical protein
VLNSGHGAFDVIGGAEIRAIGVLNERRASDRTPSIPAVIRMQSSGSETDPLQPPNETATNDPLFLQIGIVHDTVHAAEQEYRGEAGVVDRPCPRMAAGAQQRPMTQFAPARRALGFPCVKLAA